MTQRTGGYLQVARMNGRSRAAYGNVLVAALILALTYLITSVIVCTMVTAPRYKYAVGDTVEKTIYATKTIENELATEYLRNSARASVANIYMIDEPLITKQLERLDAAFASLSQVRAEASSILSSAGESSKLPTTAEGWLEKLEPSQIQALLKNVELPISQGQLLSVLASKDDEIQLLKNIVMPKISTNLGMLASDKLKSVKELCTRELYAAEGVNDELKAIGALMFEIYLVPTYIVDDEATEAAREEAALAVEPQVIEAGSVLVAEGTTLTAAQYDMLVKLKLVRDDGSDTGMYVGAALMLLAAFTTFGAYMLLCGKNVFNAREMLIICASVIISTALAWACSLLSVKLMPCLIAPIIVALMIGEMPAYAVSLLMGAVLSLMAGGKGADAMLGENASVMCFMAPIGGFVAVTLLRNSTKRARVISAAVAGGGACMFIDAAACVLHGVSLLNTVIDLAWVFGGSLIAAVFCAGTLPVWENVFNAATSARLSELTMNHPLIKRLMTEAPGTYHHCTNVAALAFGAAQAIGANAELARAGALFHDVGKLRRPQYFKENQRSGENIHDTLPPKESAAIIIAHQQDGATLLARNKLPAPVVRIAAEHHGNSLMAYFYHKAKAERDGNLVEAKDFRYNGSRPSTAESAIVMLADCCEAAVRSLGSTDREAVEELVKKVISSKYADRDDMLMNSPLTLSEITIIEKSFLKTFYGLMHERVEYPDAKDSQGVK